MTQGNGAKNGAATAELDELAPVDGTTAAELADVAAKALNALTPPRPADRSATIGKITSAIAKVMAGVTAVEKRGRNDFHKYDYAKAEDVARMIGPKLGEHGLALLPTVVEQRPAPTYDRDGNPKPSGETVDVELEILLAHESGEWISRRWIGRGQDRGDKALNKCYTVAIKTFLIATFAIPTGDDPEADTSTDERASQGRDGQGTNDRLTEAAERRQNGRQARSGSSTRSRRSEPSQTRSEADTANGSDDAGESKPDFPTPEEWRELFAVAKEHGYTEKEEVRLVAAGLLGVEGDAGNFRLAAMSRPEYEQLLAAVSKPAEPAEAEADGAGD